MSDFGILLGYFRPFRCLMPRLLDSNVVLVATAGTILLLRGGETRGETSWGGGTDSTTGTGSNCS